VLHVVQQRPTAGDHFLQLNGKSRACWVIKADRRAEPVQLTQRRACPPGHVAGSLGQPF
jgi:hypothetical protein